MVRLIFLLGSALSAQVECPLTENAGAGWTALAGISELAEKRGLAEHRVGAVLMLWRQEACDLLEEDADLSPETERALEKECRQVVYLPEGSEAQYIEAARRPILERGPTLVALAWASSAAIDGPAVHTFLVADGASSLRVTSPGYGRKGDVTTVCGASPWPLAAIRDR